MKETKPILCRYCGKTLNGQAKFHRGGHTFCNEQEATLYDYADISTLPPFPSPQGLKPIHPSNEPFDKEQV